MGLELEHECFSKHLQRGRLSVHIETRTVNTLVIFKLVPDMYDGAGDDVQAGQVRISGHLGEE